MAGTRRRMGWPHRVKELLKSSLVLLAVIAAFFILVGVLAWMRNSACDRLNDARLAHLEPGHDDPGPGSIYVIGVGTGPPPSQLDEYYDAEAEMANAGCEGTGRTGPGD
jgi:hypothetical protein